MLAHLWTNRRVEIIGSRDWIKLWAKRLLTSPKLMITIARLAWLRSRGANLAKPIFISPSIFNGKLRNLEVGTDTFIGRVELHLHDRIHVGTSVVINDGVRMLTASHEVNDSQFRQVTGPISIGDHAWIAMSAIVLPGVSIGKGAVVGAGAVVSRDVPDYGIVVGNPAKLLDKQRDARLLYNPLRFVAAYEAWLGPDMIRALEAVESFN